MAKDPAFLFYSSDFLNGVADLTMEERGQYITLLCLQHQKGNITKKTIRLCLGFVSVDVMSKFITDSEGNLFNERLISEIEKRKLFTETRRGNGSKGGRPKNYTKPLGKPRDNLVEDINENENESINNIKRGKKTKFDFNDFTDLPENYILSIQEQMFSLQAQKLEPKKILDIWEAFRLEKITGDKTYRDKKDVYLHFVNWIKKQKFTTTTPAKNELRDIQRQEYAARYAK